MGVNQSLCFDKDNKPTDKWCTYEDVNHYTNIVQISFFSTVTVFAVIVIGQFRKLLRHRRSKQYGKMFGKLYIQIFVLVFMWIFFSLSRGLISIIIYYTYMSKDFKQNNNKQLPQLTTNTGQEPSIGSPIVIFASVYTFVVFMSSWIINFLMILIPYKWLKGILLGTSQSFSLSLQSRKIISIYFRVLYAVRFYCKYVRTAFVLFLLIQPFLLFFTKFAECKLPIINYSYATSQATLILFFYIFGLCAGIYIRNNRLVQLKRRDQNRIKIQYALLVIVLITRIFLNLYTRLLNNNPYIPNNNCADTNPQNWSQQTIYMALNRYIMHFLPILLVVYIYRPSVTKKIRDRAYLNEQQQDTDDLSFFKLSQRTSSSIQQVNNSAEYNI